MGGGETVDGEFPAGAFGKVEETADVIVLVVGGEEMLNFSRGEREGGERDRLAKIASMQTVEANEFAERHDRSAASSFSAHGFLLGKVYCQDAEKRREWRGYAEEKEWKEEREQFVWRETWRFGKMLCGIREA
jgi:hypothetical protein